MRRIVKGKPLLVVTAAAAAASLIAGCNSAPVPVDASRVGGNLAVPEVDAGTPDASFVGGNLSVPDAGPPDTGAPVAPDAGTDAD